MLDAIVRLSREQNGAISVEQLRAAGLTRNAIATRVKRGSLIPHCRGVYIVGDPELLPLARESAALLSLGPNATLSHRSAAAIWGLAQSDPSMVDVTVVATNRRARPGLRLHRVRRLDGHDITSHSTLRLTSPARTLVDFAAQANTSELAQAFGEARAKRLLTDASLDAALLRAPRNHRGAAIVKSTLREGGTYDRSKAERLMRKHLKAAGLPQPRANVLLDGQLADFLWPDHKLIVEVDGYQGHGNRRAFEADRRRDQRYVAAGYVVVRVTWWQLQSEPIAVIAAIAQALARRAAA